MFRFRDTFHSRSRPWMRTYTLREIADLICRADAWERDGCLEG